MKARTNTPNPNEEFGEFAGFDTVDAICAYVYHKEGESGLRTVLGWIFDPNEQPKHDHGPREILEDAAAELERRGLNKPANILRDHAKDLRSGIEVVPDYMVRAGPQFVESWRRSWLQRRQIRLGIWDQELKQKKAKTARQSRTTTQKPASHQR